MERKKVIIATHDTKFHADDVFAVATLCLLLEKECDISIVRTRDESAISLADYAVDVGFVYDPEKRRFDHHQLGGAGVRENGIPYASFGLVWKTYGRDLCGSTELAAKIDQHLVQPVDAYDNGIQFNEPTIPGVYPYDLRELLYAFRPTWKEPDTVDEIFLQLVGWAKVLLSRQIKVSQDLTEAVTKVEEAYHNAQDKRLVVLEERYPWEEILGKFPEPQFVVYPKRGSTNWSLKAIRENMGTYESRKLLPEKWAGRNGAELEEITGVSGALFCHNRRFMAAATTKEAILKLANQALNA